MEILEKVFSTTGFANLTWGNVLMIIIGGIAIFLAIVKNYEPLLLLPIGFGGRVCRSGFRARFADRRLSVRQG